MQAAPPLPDLIAALFVLASAATLIRSAYLLIRRRRQPAFRVFTRWASAVAVYLAVSAGLSALRPERSIGLGERWCFDDWCIAVARVTRGRMGTDTVYTLDLQALNTARLDEGARYPWMFVRDEQGQHYLPETSDWVAAVESKIPPYGSRQFAVAFRLPAGASAQGFVTGHGGGRPCGVVPALLVIGEGGCLFHKYDFIRLD